MAISNLSFGAQIDAMVKKTERNMTAVFRESAKRVIEEAQANVPVDTGALRSSLQLALNAPPQPAIRTTAPTTAPAISAVIAGANLGDTVVASYGMNYATYVEYGTSKMAPRRFVGRAVAKWQGIVNRVVAEVNAKGR
jgi:HK97 gp10 family phage protein